MSTGNRDYRNGGGGQKGADLRLEPLEVSRYIAQISAELASIARASNLDVLAYFLEMAHLEAASKDEQASRP